MKYPQILTEVHLVEKFLPKGVRKSARAMYLEMIGAACTYLLDLDIDQYLNEHLRTESLLSLDNAGHRYNESFAVTE